MQRRFFSSSSSSSSSSSTSSFLKQQCRLLDAARGKLSWTNTSTSTSTTTTNHHLHHHQQQQAQQQQSQRRPTTFPCFALYECHLEDPLIGATPEEFHTRLVTLIKQAERRVLLASLYIGPAAVTATTSTTTSISTTNTKDKDHHHHHPHQFQRPTREWELLQALGEIPSHVDVKILMDSNRGLRKVPFMERSSSSSSSSQTTTTTMKNAHGGSNVHDKDGGGGETTTSSTSTTKLTVTSSAEAVAKAIQLQDNHQVYLCQVLPYPYDSLLPNPLNEIMGVFHIKAYIVDETIILSGANLSEEYFTDRYDRYIQISNGGNGLVDFYSQLIHLLCHEVSDLYQPNLLSSTESTKKKKDDDVVISSTSTSFSPSPHRRRISQSFQNDESGTTFWDSFYHLLRKTSLDNAKKNNNSNNNDDEIDSQTPLEDVNTVAVCVPTFHHPQMMTRERKPITNSSNSETDDKETMASANASILSLLPSDVDVTLQLIKESPPNATIQLASAYLNPSPLLLQVLKQQDRSVDLLTAGRLSHGFRPKKSSSSSSSSSTTNQESKQPSSQWEKEERVNDGTKSSSSTTTKTGGNKGTPWIPTVFDHLQCEALWENSRLWHWQREGWTFHAKGIWIHHHHHHHEHHDADDNEEPNLHGSHSEMDKDKEGNSPPVLLAAVIGSSNFGRRSFERDVESNLILIFPPQLSKGKKKSIPNNSLVTRLQEEWKSLLSHSTQIDNPKQVLIYDSPSLPLYVRLCFPFIKSFF